MARPTKPENQHKVRINLTLDKGVYENPKLEGTNLSQLVNGLLSVYLGTSANSVESSGGPTRMEQTRRFATDVGTRARASGPTRNRTPSLLHVKQTSYHSTIGPRGIFVIANI